MEKRRELEKAAWERNVWVPKHDNNLIQDWLDHSLFRRLLVVNLGPREPGLWLDRVREP